jgi:hypothetical protein
VGSVFVDIDDVMIGCRFDFKAVFDDGITQVRLGVDVSAVERDAVSS